MKKIIAICTFFTCILLLTQCSPKTVQTLTTTNNNTASEKVALLKKQYSSEQMDRGVKLYESNCIKCHELHEPSEFSIEKWEEILPGMSRRAHLSDDQSSLVRAYLLTNARN